MDSERYSIIFSSKTGNTKMLADAIREELTPEACDYFGNTDIDYPQSKMLYIGFWTDKGIADPAALQLLEKLHNKKIFLFGTAGFGGNSTYFQNILQKTREHIEASNTVVGEYMCQGKMPSSVKERYLKIKSQPEHAPNIDAMIENFDKAATHPDSSDIERLKEAVRGSEAQTHAN